MEAAGAGEIVLTGVNLSSYASDGVHLARLLGLLLDATSLTRFRVSSLEPESLTEELVEVLSHPRICPHFHVPVQSGSDAVLARMGRRYRAQAVREGVSRLRAAKDDPFVAIDLITGFPGETHEEFAQTLALVRDEAFSALHVFPFSPREGTRAFAMTPRVPERTRSERADQLRTSSRLLSRDYGRRWVGREVDVLFEEVTVRGMAGTSGNYLHVITTGVEATAVGARGRVLITSSGQTCRGRFVAFTFAPSVSSHEVWFSTPV